MTLLHRIASILRSMVNRTSAETDLDDELQSFVDMAAADQVRNGLTPAEARRLAILGLGGVEQTKERVRTARHGAWLDAVWRDVQYALRQVRRNPSFSAIAIATLALGIGFNTAIFSVWSGVLYAPLPGVERPNELVMLTDPAASGMLRGHDGGARRWLSYAEFLQLQEHATSLSSVMASQSRLSTWQVRVDGSRPEDVRGRLVSATYFDVLGVRPVIGRLFTSNEDSGEPPYAVISHAYWQRRFGGHPNVIGKTLIVRSTPVSIVGVTPAGFLGETSGQQPQLWLPLRLQPKVLPGSNWLHERPPDKVMWLHVFGRLRPGVTGSQAEAEANAIFQAGLQSFYGAERRNESLDQRLRLQPGARGASASRDTLSSSLSILLASVGVLLLVACANLANLLLARGAARQSEIAVRMSLGATRERLIIQLLTESLTLATLGGLAGIALACLVHGAIVRVLQQAEPHFFIGFAFTVRVLIFGVASTVASVMVFGVFPALQVTRADPCARLKESSRGAVGSAPLLRAGRWLVSVQLALSLPLLVGAGLLVRTVYNLQHTDLGFQADRLLLARVDLSDVVHDLARRDHVLRALQDGIRRLAGVEAVSFSQLGLFSGGISTAVIEASGQPADVNGRDSALDRVGADYFTTLRIPILRGRDISDRDAAATQKVCVVNEAFVREYLAGHDPLGTQVTTVDDGLRARYEVVGVTRNARTQDVRDAPEPRFFVPAEQRPSSATSRTFLIRTASHSRSLMSSVLEAVNAVDRAVSLTELVTIEERMAALTAEERILARLALTFGAAALTLAAIGLYGVISYTVGRRSGEIAIRMALGAQRRSISAMIVRETVWLIVTGLLLGGVLASVASRLLANRLYGVAPDDPLSLLLAIGVLLLVALVASLVPAQRASRLAPIAALHRG
jgi:predicted permease